MENLIDNFLQKDNITTLWDVISDENIFKFLSKNIQNKVSDVFLSNIKGFYETERKKTNNLVDMNKKYILLILNYIKQNFPEILPNKIKIFKEEIENKELITYEEIQNEKLSQFEKNLKLKQEEFTDSITLKVPEKPDFSDTIQDGPIGEMDKMIKEITAKRNYDVEEISRFNQSNQLNLKQDVNNWLKPQETSVKSEKLSFNNNNNQIKEKKHIQWADENINLEINESEESNDYDSVDSDLNILNKLKKINLNSYEKEKKDETNDILNLKDTVYILEKKFDILNDKIERILDLINK